MPGRYYAGIVIARYNREKEEIEFLIQDAEYEDRRIETKNAGGMEEPEDRRDPVRTVRREMEQELFLRIYVKPKLLVRIPRSESPEKHFFLVWFGDCKGVLRDIPISDGDTTLHIPRWVSFEEYKRLLYRTHQPVVRELERLGYREPH